jgi:hypothetical protein
MLNKRPKFDPVAYKQKYDEKLRIRDLNLQLTVASQNFVFPASVTTNQSSLSAFDLGNNANPSNQSSSSTINLNNNINQMDVHDSNINDLNDDNSSLAIVDDDDLDNDLENDKDSEASKRTDEDSISSNKTFTSVKSNLTNSTSATVKRTDKSIQLAYLDIKFDELNDFKCGKKCQFGGCCPKYLTVDEICCTREKLWKPPASFQVVTTSLRGQRYFDLLNSAIKKRNENETIYSFELDHTIRGKHSKSQICEGKAPLICKICICHPLFHLDAMIKILGISDRSEQWRQIKKALEKGDK